MSDLTDEQIRAYRLVDNKLNESKWDSGLLKAELDEIFKIDMKIFDFKFIKEVMEDGHNETGTDFEAEVNGLYKLGNHFLLCGNCTNINNINRLMGEEKADMCFVDPPYGYSYRSNVGKKFDILLNDDKHINFFPVIKQKCIGFVFVCTSWKVIDTWVSMFKKEYKLTNMIIWDKGGGGIGDLKGTFSTDYEIILCSNNGRRLTNKRLGSVWRFNTDSKTMYKHPTQKPVSLVGRAIECCTKEGEVVLDLFGGSGTTLIACEQLGRKCFIVELDKKYAGGIIKRWEDFTGKKAELISSKTKNFLKNC